MSRFLLVAACLAALSLGSADAVTKEGNIITLTDEENQGCVDGGGCLIIPRADLEKLFERMKLEAEAACGDSKSSWMHRT